MKKILFFLSIAFAIISPNSFCAHDTELQSGCKIVERELTFDDGQSNSDNLFCDICLEDIFDDDYNESETKKDSSGNKNHSHTRFISRIISDITSNKIFQPQFLFLRKTPLFIFISVFRL